VESRDVLHEVIVDEILVLFRNFVGAEPKAGDRP
jgi:hypothetical protein